MIFIAKSTEPDELKAWKKLNPGAPYDSLTGNAKEALQISLMHEQGYVCCFCGIYIGLVKLDGTVVPASIGVRPHYRGARVAHIIPQSECRCLDVDYGNLCISCPAQDGKPKKDKCHCDRAQENDLLPVHPLQADCATFFSFDENGNIDPNGLKNSLDQAAAKKTIDVLNLNAKRLVTKRIQALRAAMSAIDEDGFETVTQRYMSKHNGKFVEFYFVVLSYLSVDPYC